MAVFAGALIVVGCGSDSGVGQDPNAITREQLSGAWKLTQISLSDNQIVTASQENFDAVLTLNATGSFDMTEWQNGIPQSSSGQYIIEKDNLMLIHIVDGAQQAKRVDETIARVVDNTLTLLVAEEDHYRLLVFERQ